MNNTKSITFIILLLLLSYILLYGMIDRNNRINALEQEIKHHKIKMIKHHKICTTLESFMTEKYGTEWINVRHVPYTKGKK